MITLLMMMVNLAVGLCVGLTGIAGFLLPMFYTGFLGMPSSQSLALSFCAFLVSGILGSVNYYQAGNLQMKTALILSAGSFIGAILGVKINLLIPEDVIRKILYLVVLLSGISILLRKESDQSTRSCPVNQKFTKNPKAPAGSSLSSSQKFSFSDSLRYIFLGLSTGAVCAASGAGGPILVMPLLTVMGFPVHTAVGIALFDSIFIALPAAAGYLWHAAGNREMWFLLPILLIAHGIGVFFGSKNAVRINQTLLKRIVAVGSIGIACLKLFF